MRRSQPLLLLPLLLTACPAMPDWATAREVLLSDGEQPLDGLWSTSMHLASVSSRPHELQAAVSVTVTRQDWEGPSTGDPNVAVRLVRVHRGQRIPLEQTELFMGPGRQEEVGAFPWQQGAAPEWVGRIVRPCAEDAFCQAELVVEVEAIGPGELHIEPRALVGIAVWEGWQEPDRWGFEVDVAGL